MSVAIIVTYRRVKELTRLLKGLAESQLPLCAAVIVDHAGDFETRQVVESALLDTFYLSNTANPGPGAGWANGYEFALQELGDQAHRFWFLDDDVVIHPTVHGTLVEAMKKAGAGAIAPLLEDNQGHLWGFPEPVDRRARKLIRQAVTPGDALNLLGSKTYRFNWCTGACFLVSREALQAAGKHRPDFWMQGEDLEFSMRIAANTKAVFTCNAVVPHLPDPPSDPKLANLGGYRKFLCLLQNLAYLAFHSPYSAHLRWYLPGNARRFVRTYGWHRSVLWDVLRTYAYGICGYTAGTACGMRLRDQARPPL